VGRGIRKYSAVSFTVRRLWLGVSLTDKISEMRITILFQAASRTTLLVGASLLSVRTLTL
jgi:hypothetical protein